MENFDDFLFDAEYDDYEYDGQPDELTENQDFAQDDDFHNMYPHEDGFCYN
jgi:hypothetical protein